MLEAVWRYLECTAGNGGTAQEERFRIERDLAPIRKAVSEAEAALRAWTNVALQGTWHSIRDV